MRASCARRNARPTPCVCSEGLHHRRRPETPMPLFVLFLAACTDDKAPADDTSGADDTAGPDDTGAVDPRFQALAAAVEADIEANLATGASVAVWHGGEVVFARGFGS